MTRFRLWSPEAETATVEGLGRLVPMAPDDDRGWWTVDVPDADAGTDYRMAVDDSDARPDPRSPWQAEGVHGPSRVVDHASFEWTDRDGTDRPVLDLTTAVLYEIHIGTFTPAGTFDAAIERLDHLVDLGVDAIEVMPVAQFAGTRGWGYDGVDLFAPHESYGGPLGLKRLVDACHLRRLSVVLDVVYNHMGPEGAYLADFGPYFSETHRTLWGRAVNFDGPHSDGVRRFVIDNALMWLRDYRIDGLRIDAVHAMEDHSATHVLEELSGRVAELAAEVGRPLPIMVESDLNDPRFVRPPALGGYGCDAAWADEFHHAIHAVLTGERTRFYEDFGSIGQLAKAVSQAWVYDGTYSPHRRRYRGRPPTGLSGRQFVVSLQNHDQVGNRALGERITDLTSLARARIGAALMLTSPFVPLLFQGEEWTASTPFLYFTDVRDPELGRAVREGRQAEFAGFGWKPDEVSDPQDRATFERSRLDWSELGRRPHADMLAWYRSLIELRRRQPDLGTGPLGEVVTRSSEVPPWLMVERGSVTLVVNFGAEPVVLAVDPSRPSGVLLANPPDIGPPTAAGTLELPPDAVVLLGPDH